MRCAGPIDGLWLTGGYSGELEFIPEGIGSCRTLFEVDGLVVVSKCGFRVSHRSVLGPSRPQMKTSQRQ